jgi:AraC family transcriptional regulator
MSWFYRIPIVLAFLAAVATASAGQEAGLRADTSAAMTEETPQVELKTDTAFTYCALEMTGSYDQHSAAFEKLYEEAIKQGIYGGTPFGIYWNNPAETPVEELKWEVGFRMPAGQTAKEPLELKTWPFTTMATLEYSGPFSGEEMTNAYDGLYNWMKENGYKPIGPTMETYLNVPTPDEQGVLVGSVEIAIPIEKLAESKETKAK